MTPLSSTTAVRHHPLDVLRGVVVAGGVRDVGVPLQQIQGVHHLLHLNSIAATSACSVASPPDTAGNTTCRTVPSGARSDASAIENSFSVLRCTFLASASIARSTSAPPGC